MTQLSRTFHNSLWKSWRKKSVGLVRDSNPVPLAPKARIMPLDQRAGHLFTSLSWKLLSQWIYKYYSTWSTLNCVPETNVYDEMIEFFRHANADIYFLRRKKYRACPGYEPGTSRTLSDNHASRPTSHPGLTLGFLLIGPSLQYIYLNNTCMGTAWFKSCSIFFAVLLNNTAKILNSFEASRNVENHARSWANFLEQAKFENSTATTK